MKNAGLCINMSRAPSVVCSRLTTVLRFLSLLLIAVLISGKAHAEDCAIESRAFLTLPTDGESKDKVRAVNNQLLAVYRKYYCLDPRTYYLQAAYVLSQVQTQEDKVRASIGQFRLEHNLPGSLSKTGGDNRRSAEFINLFNQYRASLPQEPSNVSLQNYEVILITGFMNEATET